MKVHRVPRDNDKGDRFRRLLIPCKVGGEETAEVNVSGVEYVAVGPGSTE